MGLRQETRVQSEVPRAREGCKCGPLREAVREQPGDRRQKFETGTRLLVKMAVAGPLKRAGHSWGRCKRQEGRNGARRGWGQVPE